MHRVGGQSLIPLDPGLPCLAPLPQGGIHSGPRCGPRAGNTAYPTRVEPRKVENSLDFEGSILHHLGLSELEFPAPPFRSQPTVRPYDVSPIPCLLRPPVDGSPGAPDFWSNAWGAAGNVEQNP